MIMAVDLGYGWTKAAGGGRTFREPSVIGPAQTTVEGLGPQLGVRVWDQGEEYFVGALALRECHFPWHNLEDDKTDNPHTLRLLKAAMAGVMPQPQGAVQVDVLVSGLPVNHWARQKTPLEQRLRMQDLPVRARIGQVAIHAAVTVGTVRVLAQPFGSLLDYVLDDYGQLVRAEAVRGRVLVIDIGFHTVDLLACDGLEPVGRLSLSTNFGLGTAFAALGKRLNKPVWEVDQLALAGRVDGLQEAYRHLAGNISLTVQGLNETFDLNLVTGGGGTALYPYLQLEGRKELMTRPQLANVRGYLKAGERLRRQGAKG